ncbi:hypothetical protein ACFSSA_14075 [Luteolibacter algae]|uniref:Cobalt transporter n=2 Tax=Luteolibacter algae TaxID=454151 RepID=A0ABW5DBH1_9BACT
MNRNSSRAAVLGLFLSSAAIVSAHPGPPGHYHPYEVDEFDEPVTEFSAKPLESDFDLGGLLVLTGVAACLGFAFFQKDGGIWSDATSRH